MADSFFRSPLTRRGLLGAGLAAMALPLAACSSPVAAGLSGAALDPSTLVFWNLFGGGDGSRMQAMERGYAKANGGPSAIQATTFAWGNPYYSKVTLSTVGNKPPDVAVAHLTRAKLLADGDLLEAITAQDLASVGLTAADLDEKSWTAQRTNGHDIAIPLDTHPFVMFFNKDVLDEAGLLTGGGKLQPLQGMDDFESALAEISKVTGGAAITIANVNEFATPWRMFLTLYSQIDGAPPYLGDDGTTITVDRDAAEQVLGTLTRWVQRGWLNRSLDYASAGTAMYTGKAGLYLQGEWEITTAQQIEGLEFGMVPVPQLFDTPANQADSHTFVLPKKDRTAEQRLQAMRFIKSMLDQSMTWAEGGHVPAYVPFRDSSAYKALEPQADYAVAAERAVYDPGAWYSGSGSTFETIAGSQMALVQQGSISPKGALAEISDQLQVYLRTPSPL